MKKCKDCGVLIHEMATHTGHEKWCEDCFDTGLQKDMNDHFKHTIKKELAEYGKLETVIFAQLSKDSQLYRKFTKAPTVVDKKFYSDLGAFYEAEAVERQLMHYREICEQIEKSSQHLPEFFLKFYFDVKRRVDHEAAQTVART